MGTLYENIMTLCNEKGIKGGKMCTDIGLSKSLMTDLKNGRKSGVTTDTAQKIADYFGVSVARVITGEEQKNKPAPIDGNGPNANPRLTREQLVSFLKICGVIKEDEVLSEADFQFLTAQVHMLDAWQKQRG